MTDKGISLFETQMQRQADWLKDLRSQLLRKANIRTRKNILDIGCGTGIITSELKERSKNTVTGIDINPDRINIAKNNYSNIDFICSDILNNNFKDESFDLITTSFVWLWVKDKEKLAKEIVRLLKPRGIYLSLAEMDYEARIDYPDDLKLLKELYIEILKKQGADPFAARQIPAFFNDKNLNMTSGSFCHMFKHKQLLENFEPEWIQLKEDIKSLNITDYNVNELYKVEKESIENKTRFVFMPVFWLNVVKI